MSYAPLPDPLAVGPGEGESVGLGDASVRFVAPGAATGGAFGLFEYAQPPGPGASPHTHLGIEESFYVLSGTLDVLVGSREVSAGPGSFVLVPRGTRHGFANRSAEPARFLILFTPGLLPREGYFRGLGALLEGGGPPDPERLQALLAAYDQQPVE